ncbi:MAG: hypothetical protein ACP5F9_10270 [Thiomonas sp.]
MDDGSQEPVRDAADSAPNTAARSRAPQPADLLANATHQHIALADIRGAHALLTRTLEKTHPRPIDDVLTLTPAAVQILCAQHPLIVRTAGRGKNKGFEVLGGLLAWRALRPHHARLGIEKPTAVNSSSTQGEIPTPDDVATESPPQTAPESKPKRRRRSYASSPLSREFQIPALVLGRKVSDEDIDTLLLAERWLLLSCVGPLKALQSELEVLHRQTEHRKWIDDLTPDIPSLAALSRVLGTSRQTLHARRRKTSFRQDHDDPPNDTDGVAQAFAAEQRRPEGGCGADLDRSP